MISVIAATLLILQGTVPDSDIYWVFFTDRGENVQGRLDEAEEAVRSGMSMERRSIAGCLSADQYDLQPYSEYIASVETVSEVPVRTASRYLNAVSVELTADQVMELQHASFVQEVRPVCSSTFSPSEEIPAADSYGLSLSQLSQINLFELQQRGWTGQGVTVGILDTGFELDHPCLQSVSVLAEYDFVNEDSVVAWQEGDPEEQASHGTKVLSVMAGYDPDLYIGGAFNAAFLLAKTEVTGEESQVEEDYWVSGLEWLEFQGADLVNSSLGYSEWYEPWQMDGNTAVTTVAADLAASRGLVVFNSSGNNGPGDTTLVAPSDGDSVFASGAVDGSGLIAGFSSRGPTADGRIKPDGCARGYLAVTASFGGSGYSSVNGTSFASPLMASAAACISSAHPDWPMMRIFEALRETADRSGNPDNTYGYGVVDALAAVMHRSVVGQVRRSDTGEPIEGLTITVAMQSGTSVSVTSNNQGYFAVEPEVLGGFTATSQGWGVSIPVSGILDDSGADIIIYCDPVSSDQQPSVYPNPSASEFYIGFDVAGESADVSLSVYTVAGELVFSRSRSNLQPGCYRAPVDGQAFHWDGTVESGDPAASGQYIAVLKTGESVSLLNLALIRGAEEQL